MSNLFLKVDKDLFKIGLSPIEILIVAQVLDFQLKKMDCYISNESFAKDFSMSEKTVGRAIKSLEDKGILSRQSTNTRNGKLRYMTINTDKITEISKGQNDPCESNESNDKEISKGQFVPSAKVNLSNSKGQDDPIKEKEKEKKENQENGFISPAEEKARLKAQFEREFFNK